MTQHYNNIIKKQFQLAYFSHIPTSDSDDMPIHEFNVIYSMLTDQLKMEKDEIEQAKQTAKMNGHH